VITRILDYDMIHACGTLMLVPLDPLVSQAGDSGRPLLDAYPQSAQADAFRQVAQRLADKLHSTRE
jgi:MinD-like ATPase involved in chromosome partitioning or flagellar assembly